MTRSGTVFGIIVVAGVLVGAIFAPTIGWIADGVGMRLALWRCFVILIANLTTFLRTPTWTAS